MPKDAPLKYGHMVEKSPTELHTRFVDWLVEKTGYEGLDPKSVQLATALRMDFQRSPENQTSIGERKTAKATAAEERVAKAAEREARRKEIAKKKATAASDEDKPAAPAKKAIAASDEDKPAAPAKKAIAPRARRTTKKVEPVDEVVETTTDEDADETDF